MNEWHITSVNINVQQQSTAKKFRKKPKQNKKKPIPIFAPPSSS
jgi:hypothetical protein